MIFPNGAGSNILYPPGSLKEIIFGAMMPDGDKQTIKDIFKNNPDQDPKFFDARLSDREYKVIIDG